MRRADTTLRVCMHVGGGEGGLNLTELPVSTKWDSGVSLTQTHPNEAAEESSVVSDKYHCH